MSINDRHLLATIHAREEVRAEMTRKSGEKKQDQAANDVDETSPAGAAVAKHDQQALRRQYPLLASIFSDHR